MVDLSIDLNPVQTQVLLIPMTVIVEYCYYCFGELPLHVVNLCLVAQSVGVLMSPLMFHHQPVTNSIMPFCVAMCRCFLENIVG